MAGGFTVLAARGDDRAGSPSPDPASVLVDPARASSCATRRRHQPAVVLHLRSRYVSKAAILGLPGHIVPVKKSKSHLNSKGLDR
jgi:hypothetical protein